MDNNDIASALNNILNSNQIPDNIREMLNGFASSNNDSGKHSKKNDIDLETLLKMKSIMDKLNSNKDDPRANLLRSLKPYLKESRKAKVDQYAKLFAMSSVMELFGNGGDIKK